MPPGGPDPSTKKHEQLCHLISRPIEATARLVGRRPRFYHVYNGLHFQRRSVTPAAIARAARSDSMDADKIVANEDDHRSRIAGRLFQMHAANTAGVTCRCGRFLRSASARVRAIAAGHKCFYAGNDARAVALHVFMRYHTAVIALKSKFMPKSHRIAAMVRRFRQIVTTMQD